MEKGRTIIHLDIDAFYPSVEVLDNPHLRGRPVIVGGTVKRGVVSSASYEARKYGVHSAQPIATALRLCPNGVFLPVRMSRYRDLSRAVFDIFYRFTPLVEPLSIDEAFLDVTGSTRLFGSPVEIARRIKKAVRDETGLTISAGIAPSKFVAKIASDMDKPDGLTHVPRDRVRDFLGPLPLEKMWGVGEVSLKALTELKVRTFEDLSRVPVHVLERKFGKYGARMHQLSLGEDEREVVPQRSAKSLGHEVTFQRDIKELDTAKKELLSLAHRVARRLRRHGLTGKTITLKVKYWDFIQVTRSETIQEATDDGGEIYSIACALLEKTDTGKTPVRLLGISLSQLDSEAEGQLSLFRQEEDHSRRKNLNRALDSLYDKFGEKGILPGSLLKEK
ncbi:MAG: DNA polymerase IV [Deltaproteobacteria bacterium]|nr:DNA polymerase IV [Deltaproteobacteria bacterium]MBW2137364.1 DNA polymerase IV [Deltaproteobacteria bacterium]